MKRKYAWLLLVFLFSLTNLFIIKADGINQGLESEEIFKDYIINKNINSARISIYEITTKRLLAESNITSLNYTQGSNIYYLTGLNKVSIQNKNVNDFKIIIKTKLQHENGFTPANQQLIILPKMIANNDSNIDEILKKRDKWFLDIDNAKKVFKCFKNDYDEYLNQWISGSLCLLVEPMVCLEKRGGIETQTSASAKKAILLTTTEIGLLDTNVGLPEYCYVNLPHSNYKINSGCLTQIPIYNKYFNPDDKHTEEHLNDMIKMLGCFEVIYNSNIATPSEAEIATKSDIEISTSSEIREFYTTYYTNSWVVTGVDIKSKMGFPRQSYTPKTNKDYAAKEGCLNKKLAEITYEFDCSKNLEVDYHLQKLAIPMNSTAVSWVKWKCPSEPCTVVIDVTTNDEDAVPKYNQIVCTIIDPITGLYPPNAEATDRNDGFHAPGYATGSWDSGSKNTLSWKTYNYQWNYYWVYGCNKTIDDAGNLTEWGLTQNWDANHICEAHECPDVPNHVCPTGKCHGIIEDWGYVTWSPVFHTLTLEINNEDLYRSENSPNTNGSDYSIKSGYGVELNVDTNCILSRQGLIISVNDVRNAVVPPQYMEVFLPEYNYENYAITSFNDYSGKDYEDENTFTLPTNPYSQFGQKCHFTPIWYPDGRYVIGTKISQCFCPAGMLYICNGNTSINISGNAYDDWHIAPEMN